MDYFLKENKPFLVAVAAGLLGAILYNSFILQPLNHKADQARRSLQKERAELKMRMEHGVPSEESLRMARATRERSRQSLAALVKEVEFKVPDRFKKPERETAKSYFEDQIVGLHKDLLRDAVKGSTEFPKTSAGFGFGDQVGDDIAAECLLRLAVVARVAQVAIESGVEKIEAIDGMAGAPREETSAKKSPFLSRLGVFMKFSGKAESVFKVLHGVQKKGQYLAVTNFEAAREDQTKDLFTASIFVSLLKVDEKGTMETK